MYENSPKLIHFEHNGYDLVYNPCLTDITDCGVVYSIIFPFEDGIQYYIGETIQSLNERITDHCSYTKNGHTTERLRQAFTKAKEHNIPIEVRILDKEIHKTNLQAKERTIIEGIINYLRQQAKGNGYKGYEAKRYIAKCLLNKTYT